MVETMAGFASVEISPKTSEILSRLSASSRPISLPAIFLKIRRMIFPDRVLGRSGTITMRLGVAKGPI